MNNFGSLRSDFNISFCKLGPLRDRRGWHGVPGVAIKKHNIRVRVQDIGKPFFMHNS